MVHRINGRIKDVEPAPRDKFRVRLECGHEYLCDFSCQQPGRVTACSQCEDEAEAADKAKETR